MRVKVNLRHLRGNWLGYECKHCYSVFPFLDGALMHEETINELGYCPLDLRRKDKTEIQDSQAHSEG